MGQQQQKRRCLECNYCDAPKAWCKIKALVVKVDAERNCKQFLDRKYGRQELEEVGSQNRN